MIDPPRWQRPDGLVFPHSCSECPARARGFRAFLRIGLFYERHPRLSRLAQATPAVEHALSWHTRKRHLRVALVRPILPRQSVEVVAMRIVAMAIFVGTAPLLVACNPERNQECERFLAVMKPLDEPAPSIETVDRVAKDLEAINLQDQPLQIYATNYRNTLTVLSNTLKLQKDPSAPDGTDDVVKTHLKEARADSQDVRRYCAQ
jgi:hypothetical protein